MDHSYASLALNESLQSVLNELGYETPTLIQSKSIPVLLSGGDLVGQSKTGSGKTAAFALPILQNIDLKKKTAAQALVVCPTRELSSQVVREMRKLGRKHEGLTIVSLTGGESVREQTASLEHGVHIVVGTPGRLLDHLQRETLVLRHVTTLVLDEADRMLDMGFQADVESLIAKTPGSRQTVFFSATFSDAIQTMSDRHQNDAVHITVDEEAPKTITQLCIEVEAKQRLHALYWALDQHPSASVLVFCNFKASVKSVVESLRRSGASVDCLHGDLDQFQRDQVLVRFKSHALNILVATDVAARGLDVKDLDLVVNYELPSQPDTYVHRIGRTGRAGKEGVSISLYTLKQTSRMEELSSAAGSPMEELAFNDRIDIDALARSFVPAHMSCILISGGRKDKVRAGDILGALTGESGGLDGNDIGKIEIHDRLAYVAVPRRIARSTVKSLNAGRIKGKRFRATLVGDLELDKPKKNKRRR